MRRDKLYSGEETVVSRRQKSEISNQKEIIPASVILERSAVERWQANDF